MSIDSDYSNDFGDSFNVVPDSKKLNVELQEVIEKVKKNGLVLGQLAPRWQNNKRVVLEAVRQNGLAIRYAPKFNNNFAIGLMAVSNNGLARLWLGNDLLELDIIKKIYLKNLPKKLPKSLVSEDFLISKTNKMVSSYILFPAPEKNQDLLPIYNGLRTAAEAGFNTNIRFSYLEDPGVCEFIRDAGVCLAQGKILIPYNLQVATGQAIEKKLYAVLPNVRKLEELDCNISFYGHGFAKDSTDELMITAAKNGIPYKKGKTCIEGGNCIVFMQDGIEKALIGEWSLYLSFFALKEQNYFILLDDKKNIKIEIQDPSLMAFRMARNLKIFKEFKKAHEDYDKIRDDFLYSRKKKRDKKYDAIDHLIRINSSLGVNEKYLKFEENRKCRIELYNGDLSEFNSNLIAREFDEKYEAYKKRLDAPVSMMEIWNNYDKARKLDNYLKITMARISKELEIPLQNITFLPQCDFHIDMEVFVPPNGPVVLNDHEKSREFLSGLNPDEYIKKFIKSAGSLSRVYKDIQLEREKILVSKNIPFMNFPAVFSLSERCQLNYCNGIFLGNKEIKQTSEKEFVFVTTGPSFDFENQVHEKFSKLFAQTFPHISLMPIPGMSKFIDDQDGGIRCLTIECFNVAKNIL